MPEMSLRYNSVDFPTNTETLEMSLTPVYDRAERTVIYNRYLLKVRARFTSTSTTDTTMEGLRILLSEPGQDLTYAGRGFGDFVINRNSIKDVKWGPKPRLLSFRPAGGQLAADITWQVEVCIADCQIGESFREMEWNYRVTFDRDYAGYTTRTINGTIAISQTRMNGGRQLTKSVDEYFLKILPIVPLGFQRRSNRSDIDDAKCRLDFSVTDQQMAMPLPAGVVDCQASHRVANSKPFSFQHWSGTIEASYEMAAGWRRDIPLAHFLEMAENRLLDLKLSGLIGAKGMVVISNFSMSEPEIFGRRCASFSLSYIVTTTLPELLTPGLWRQVFRTNYGSWAQSVETTAHAPRGTANMVVRPEDDAIIDLCLKPQKPRPKPTITNGPTGLIPRKPRLLVPNCPPPAMSWMDYVCTLSITDDMSNVIHIPVPKSKPRDEGSVMKFSNKPTKTNDVDLNFDVDANFPDPIVQKLGADGYYVVLEGYALRVCYEIPRPSVVRVGGSAAIPMNREGREFFETKLVGNTGLPMYQAQWRLRYFIGPPAKPVKPQENPIIKGRVLKQIEGPLSDLLPNPNQIK